MRYLITIALFITTNGYSQWKDYIIGAKGDTLNRLDKNGLKQGRWVVHVDDLRGERGYEEEGVFIIDKKEGTWRKYTLEGDLTAIENYRYGFKNGKNVYFNDMGDPLREESWRAVDPKNPYDTINVYDVTDPNKVIGVKVIKLEPASYKNGTWTYYNSDRGTIAKTEEWVMDKQKDAPIATTDDLAPINVGDGTTAKDEKKQVAKPREVLEFEKKNSGKKRIKVRDGSTGG